MEGGKKKETKGEVKPALCNLNKNEQRGDSWRPWHCTC
jgi:hypothetical protein